MNLRVTCSRAVRLVIVFSVTPETSTPEKVASRVRTGAPSWAMATLRRLIIGALRLAGRTDIAGGLRYRARNPLTYSPLQTSHDQTG